MSYGMLVKAANGEVIFDDATLSLRVIKLVQVRGGFRRADLQVAVPEARAGQVALVLQRTAHAPSPYGSGEYIGYAPMVDVGNGYIRLWNFKSAFRGDISSGSVNPGIDCNVDIALVALG